MKNSIKKIIYIAIILIVILSSNIFAVSDIFSQADNWISTGKANTNTTTDTTELRKASDMIYNVLLGIGIAVAIIVGAILGIQFMTAGIDQKVQVKESLVPYIISCVVVFGAFGIWKLVVTLLGSITN